ncbi:MAG: hypothetical protein WBG92_17200 [Thiohalocapsa sp.]
MLWCGFSAATGWLGALAWAIHDMEERLTWSDMGANLTTEQSLAIFLNPNFVATGSRIQEAVAYILVAVLIATVVWRARRTARRPLELDKQHRILSDIFGRYVPRGIADALINDHGLLQPVEDTATVLLIDLAGLTKMTKANGLRRVVGVLTAFFRENRHHHAL